MYQRFTHPEEEEIPQLVETPSKKERWFTSIKDIEMTRGLTRSESSKKIVETQPPLRVQSFLLRIVW